MPDGGEREARLTADYNAEMIEHIARFPRVRDRAIFVGDPGRRCSGLASGPGLPRDPRLDRGSTSTSPAYSPASTPPSSADRAALRAELGFGDDEQVCVVTVGGRASARSCCAG